MKNSIAIASVFLLLVVGCTTEKVVQVEIENPEHREFYIDLLNKKGLVYRIDQNQVIYVTVSSEEELHEKTKEFEEFVAREIRNNNRELETEQK